ncbi:flagellar filament capping protein FliD [Nocardioides mangrovi]|uniref:Flagellar hook-associated protein 2 n=1 Tax=Nocardioides mangrovi TaxID=2874580 RepID=A0ABS7UAD7_9ACTN|nr:flagellar filament capping protein FliD [Nocardioides mangrovi]MBZ5737804.1 flagellar filament capping protein FliD [Nocardioides mangrovi]
MATSTSSISGLASGLDTASIISQLMTLEAQPQTRLKTQQTTEKSVVSALQTINTSVASLATAAASLAKASTWQTVKGTSSATGFSVTTSTGATAGSFDVKVVSLASRSQAAFSTASGLSDTVTSQNLTLTTNDGTEHDVDTGSGSLTDVIKGINDLTSETGITATAVKVADGSYKLLVQSATTGADTSFTLTNADGSDLLGGATVKDGTDASIDLGLGVVATSSTNTFEDVTPGVDLTLSSSLAVGDTSTISLAQDSSDITATVKSLVDSINSILTSIDTQSKFASSSSSSSTSTTSSGVLAGDAVTRDLRYALLNTVFGGTGSMATAGIQTTRDGMLTFDEDTFTAAYAADPEGIAAKFTSGATTDADGFAARVATVAKAASDSIDGSVTKAVKSHNTLVDTLQSQIDDWDTRLALKKSTLEAQYTALETTMQSLNSQSSYLTSQIAGLPTWGSSSSS